MDTPIHLLAWREDCFLWSLLELPIKELDGSTIGQIPHTERSIGQVQNSTGVAVATLQVADGTWLQNSLVFVAVVEGKVSVTDDQYVGFHASQIFLELLRQAVAGGILKHGSSVVRRSGVGQQ